MHISCAQFAQHCVIPTDGSTLCQVMVDWKCHYLMHGCSQKKYTTLSWSQVLSVESNTLATTEIGNGQSWTALRLDWQIQVWRTRSTPRVLFNQTPVLPILWRERHRISLPLSHLPFSHCRCHKMSSYQLVSHMPIQVRCLYSVYTIPVSYLC
jgi:hypothetical protein